MERSLHGTENDRRQKYLSKLKELKLFDDTFFFHCISTFPMPRRKRDSCLPGEGGLMCWQQMRRAGTMR